MSDVIDFNSDTEVLACWLFDIPVKQKVMSVKVLEKETLIMDLKNRIQLAEDFVALEINNEVDDKGKPVFSNQSIRDSEMRVRLSKDDAYQRLRNQLSTAYEEKGEFKAKVEYWVSMFSATKNEVYHRRALSLLDSKKDLADSEVKRVLNNL